MVPITDKTFHGRGGIVKNPNNPTLKPYFVLPNSVNNPATEKQSKQTI
jgi:hypothetical protein